MTASASKAAQCALHIRVGVISSPDDIRERWLDLERRSQCSLFQTWAWIGCWLRTLPSEIDVHAVEILDADRIIGLGLLVPSSRKQFALRPMVRRSLNQTGNQTIDPISIEYNGLLLDRDAPREVLTFAIDKLTSDLERPSELRLDGLDGSVAESICRAARDVGAIVWVDQTQRCDFVDLSSIRGSIDDYLAKLSANARQQVRRAIRGYEDIAGR